jgi:hypothetical protein
VDVLTGLILRIKNGTGGICVEHIFSHLQCYFLAEVMGILATILITISYELNS